ncbi:MAG: hypothetical protein JWQ27_2123 [Ferruginibacter sp.]|nr:hypothetical protein [Ferruginibacter sp.]
MACCRYFHFLIILAGKINLMKKEFTRSLLTLICLLTFTLLTSAQQAAKPKMGKYGCTASHYNSRTGMYEYTPRGFVTLNSNGSYSYAGFKKPSIGKYSVDAAGNILFSGGYLDHGKAEKIDRPNKYFLVFPTIPDNRWTMGLAE